MPTRFFVAGMMLCLSACSSAIQSPEFLRWQEIAHRDMHTPQGTDYSTAITQQLAVVLLQAFTACVQSGSLELEGALPDPFTAFLRIEANGAVSDAFITPKTMAARCFRTHLPTHVFLLQPPSAPFYFRGKLSCSMRGHSVECGGEAKASRLRFP